MKSKDKKAKLEEALRQNLLRRKESTKRSDDVKPDLVDAVNSKKDKN